MNDRTLAVTAFELAITKRITNIGWAVDNTGRYQRSQSSCYIGSCIDAIAHYGQAAGQ